MNVVCQFTNLATRRWERNEKRVKIPKTRIIQTRKQTDLCSVAGNNIPVTW